MPQKFDTRKRDLLLSDERQQALQPGKLLRGLGLARGQTLADIGSGPGFFTIPAAEIVGPSGQVYAADIQGEMLSAVRSRVAEHGLKNVRLVKTSDAEVPITPGSCDLALLAFTLHEVPQRAAFLHRVARLVKPEGQVVVLEWEKDAEDAPPPPQDRISREELELDARAAGLEQRSTRDLGRGQYLVVYVPTAGVVKEPSHEASKEPSHP